MLAGGDFECTTSVRFKPVHQYDQAGLMVRLSSFCWLKTSVEYEPDGPARLGVVVTNGGYSDWSTQDVDPALTEIALRVERMGADYSVAFQLPSSPTWTQMRLARLHEDRSDGDVHAGLYICSPKRAGFEAAFEYLRLRKRPVERNPS
jgi:regulation of enolase protein 1 (concanavalin A-like superfamily)